MHKTQSAFVAAATILASALNAHPALALAARTFVSAGGNDVNACSLASPCRTFQAAYAATSPGGEIDVLDPAGYGSVTISKAISIQGHGYAGITAASGATAITINASSTDKINLRGLLIDGMGSGSTGVNFGAGASLNIQQSVIRNFAYGVNFQPTAASSLFISDSVISENSSYGLAINSGAAPVTGVLNRVALLNGSSAISIQAVANVSASLNITVANSVIGGANYGVLTDTGGASSTVMLWNSTVSANGSAVQAQDASVIYVGASTITQNVFGWATFTGGTVDSYGNNNIDDNGNDNSAPPGIPTK